MPRRTITAVVGVPDVEAAFTEERPEHLADVRAVIDDEDPGTGRRPVRSSSTTPLRSPIRTRTAPGIRRWGPRRPG